MGALLLAVFVVATVAVTGCSSGSTLRRQLAGAVLTILPALLITIVLLQSDDTGESAPQHSSTLRYRVTLAGFRFRSGLHEPASIGGDAQDDSLYVRGLPRHFLRLATQDGASGGLWLEARADGEARDGPAAAPADRRGRGLAVFRLPKGQNRPALPQDIDREWGGLLFPAGSWLCMPDRHGGCDRSRPMLTWEVHGGVVQLYDGSHAALCTLPGKAAAEQLPPERSIFPLAAFARTGCSGDTLFTWDFTTPAADFLYWGGDLRSRLLYIRANSRTPLVLKLADGQVRPVAGPWLFLKSGEEIDVHLFRYAPDTELPTRPGQRRNTHDQTGGLDATNAKQPTPYSKLAELRSFRLRYTREQDAPHTTTEIFFDTPEQVRVSARVDAPLSIVSLSANPASLRAGWAAAGFQSIGAPAARELINTIRLVSADDDQKRPCGRAGHEVLLVQNMSTLTCAPLGHWFTLGDAQRVQLRVRVALLSGPVGWIAAAWLLVIANSMVRYRLQVPASLQVVLGFLELLLGLRLLVAFDAATLDPLAESAVAGAWLALLWVPLAFELVSPSAAQWLQACTARLLKLLLAIAGTSVVARAQHSIPASLPETWTFFVSGPGKVVLLTAGLAIVIAATTRAWFESFWVLPSESGQSQRVAVMLLGGVTFLHLVLILSGHKEQVGTLRISALIVPLLVLAWTHWEFVFARAQQQQRWWAMPARVVAPFLPFTVFVLAHDNGAFIYFLALAVFLSSRAWPQGWRPWLVLAIAAVAAVSVVTIVLSFLDAVFREAALPACILLAVALSASVWVVTQHRRWLESRLWLTAPLVAAMSAVCALHLAGAWIDLEGATTSSSGQTPIVETLRGVEVRTNVIRLMNQVKPEAVEQLGSREGYQQRAAMLEMYDYAASLMGRGWPQSTPPRELKNTHVNDTVAAVHLLSPFGRLAGVGIAIFLLGFAAAVFTLAEANPHEPALAAVLASLVLVGTSLYMLFANVGAVPFTGRNFYFLSVQSASDLLEGGLLLSIVAAGSVAARRPRE